MRRKPLDVHGDCGDFSVVLFIRSRLRIRQKYFSVQGNALKAIKRIRRKRQRHLAVYGEYDD